MVNLGLNEILNLWWFWIVWTFLIFTVCACTCGYKKRQFLRRTVQTPTIVTISPNFFANETVQNQGYTGDNALPTGAYVFDVTDAQNQRSSNTQKITEFDISQPPPTYSSIVKS